MNQETRLMLEGQWDSHVHLHGYEHPDQMVKAYASLGMRAVVMTEDPVVFGKVVEDFGSVEGVFPALGFLPHGFPEIESLWSLFVERLSDTRFVGEVGLDYAVGDASLHRRQRFFFERIVAASEGKVLSIHSRRAAADVVEIARDAPGVPVLHWFSGAVSLLEDWPGFVSFNTAMAFSERGELFAKAVPRDRVLLESDGPYVLVGDAPVLPRDLAGVIRWLAKVWKCEPMVAADQLRSNALEVLA